MAEKWIQGMEMKKGALTAMAKRSGKSLDEYCAGDKSSLKAKKRCSLRKTLSGFNKNK